MRSSCPFVLAVMLLGGVTLSSSPQALAVDRSKAVPADSSTPATGGTVLGNAWQPDNTPLGDARVRLRDVKTGIIVATVVANANGEFRFDKVETGSYLVELVNDRGWVRAVGRLFNIEPGKGVAVSVRLAVKIPWFPGFFGNSATSAIVAATRVGVTAIGSNGLPASPQ